MNKRLAYIITGLLVVSLTGNIVQYAANQRQTTDLNTALATSQSQIDTSTTELSELKRRTIQLEQDYSALQTDYATLLLELGDPAPELTDDQQSSGTQSQPTESQQSKPSGGTSTKPQPSGQQQQQQQESVSGDDYSGLPGSGLTADDYKDAGVPDTSDMFDNGLWDDVPENPYK